MPCHPARRPPPRAARRGATQALELGGESAAVAEVRADQLGRLAAHLARVAPDHGGEHALVLRRRPPAAALLDQEDGERPQPLLGLGLPLLAVRQYEVPERQRVQQRDRDRREAHRGAIKGLIVRASSACTRVRSSFGLNGLRR
jgi:hypothetical protein